MIGILALILIIMLAILFFTKTINNREVGTNVEKQNGQAIENVAKEQNNTPKEQERIIKVNGKLYYDTGKNCDEIAEVQRCGTMDGNITSIVARTEIPQKDGEANFEGARGYQFGREENQIDVPLENEGWVIFEKKEFIIKCYDKSSETDNKIHKILDKAESDKYDYNIYAYNVNVNIVINGEEISLRNALLENKITMDEIIEKANKDIKEPIVYKDGGSKMYRYDTYAIIKCNRLSGNKDVYFGMPGLDINDLNIIYD